MKVVGSIPTTPTRFVTLRYLEEYRCLGADCEDTCCAHWVVPVDRLHDRAIRRTVGFDGLAFPAVTPSEEMASVLKLKEDGTCYFLDQDKLCFLHKKHGEDSIPDACAMYPLQVAAVGDRGEVTGALSCPAVARLALLREDAMDVVPADAARAGRGVVGKSTAKSKGPWVASLDAVRGTWFGLLGLTEFPLAERLFFMAEFAERLEDPARLAEEIDRIERTAVLHALVESYRSAEVPVEAGPAVVLRVLGERLEGAALPTFKRHVNEVMKALAAELGVAAEGDKLRLDPGKLGPVLAARRDERAAKFGGRLDLVLGNYARNAVMRDWFLSAPSPAVWVQRLLTKIAILRMLLLAHPRLDETAAAGPDALDRLAVEVIYSFARTFEHAEQTLAAATDKLFDGVPRLAVAVTLLRV